MKLRLKGNSVRLRLSRGDIEQLILNGSVAEVVEFGSGGPNFTYAIETGESVEAVNAKYRDNELRIAVSAQDARRWAESEQVGLESNVNGLRILIEKDFTCLKPRVGEDESDMFPHPQAASY